MSETENIDEHILLEELLKRLDEMAVLQQQAQQQAHQQTLQLEKILNIVDSPGGEALIERVTAQLENEDADLRIQPGQFEIAKKQLKTLEQIKDHNIPSTK